jgi:hypothetical protein
MRAQPPPPYGHHEASRRRATARRPSSGSASRNPGPIRRRQRGTAGRLLRGALTSLIDSSPRAAASVGAGLDNSPSAVPASSASPTAPSPTPTSAPPPTPPARPASDRPTRRSPPSAARQSSRRLSPPSSTSSQDQPQGPKPRQPSPSAQRHRPCPGRSAPSPISRASFPHVRINARAHARGALDGAPSLHQMLTADFGSKVPTPTPPPGTERTPPRPSSV